MDNLKNQGTKAFVWDFSGKLAMHGMTFVVSIFLARLLEPSDFGLVAMVMVIIGIAGIFSDVGLGSALIQRRRVLPVHYASVFFFNITLGTLLALITYLSAPYIAGFYDNDALIELTQVISILFIIGAFSAVQSTKLRKELNYALLTKVSFVAALCSGVVGIGLALYGAGVWSLVAQSLTQGIVYNILIWTKSQWKPSFLFSFKALIQLWAFGFRMFLSSLLDTVFTRLDTIIIAKLFAPATLGFFNRAKALDQMVITYSSSSLVSVLFPLLSKVQNDLPRFRHIIKKALGLLVFVVFMLLGVLYLTSYELIVLMFGEKWVTSVGYFQILVLSGFGYPVSALFVNVLGSRGNSKAFLRLEIYKKILLAINLAVAFRWGVEGYLYGYALAMLGAVYLNIYFASREIALVKMALIKPIVLQAFITVSIVLFLSFINQGMELPLFVMLVLKSSEFIVLYILVNRWFKVESYAYFMQEAKPLFEKLVLKAKKR